MLKEIVWNKDIESKTDKSKYISNSSSDKEDLDILTYNQLNLNKKKVLKVIKILALWIVVYLYL